MSNDLHTTLDARASAPADEDPQLRAAMPKPEVVTRLRDSNLTPARIAEIVLTAYADRPALAQRAVKIDTDPRTGRRHRRLLPRFVALSYAELADRVRAVAAACRDAGNIRLLPGDFVCVIGSPGIDFTTIDLACARLGAVVVPLHADVTSDTLTAIVAETEPILIAVAADQLSIAVHSLRDTTVPRRLLCFDFHPDDDGHRDALDAATRALEAFGGPVTIETLPALIERGTPLPDPPLAEVALDSTASLLYTSGSTGAPKGVIYTARTAAGMWAARGEMPCITVHFMPLSHLAGRNALYSTLADGGTVHFTGHADMSTLLEDIEMVRPTRLRLVPRVCEAIHQRYHEDVARRVEDGSERIVAEREARESLRREALGGRVVWALCGTAALPAELHTFLESVLELKLHDAYGSTEAGAILADGRVMRPPVVDYKLADVPELGYFGTDVPHPRGELLLRSRTLTPGYFRRPEATAEAFDAAGYYRTGDIVAELEPDRLRLIDRRSSVLKLARGEFVAVSQIESILGAAPLIRQIFVYGSGARSYLLAVVVPANPDATKSDLLRSLRKTARSAGLSPYEIPRDILIETEPFGIGNGLLSGVGKLLRPMLHRTYGERLERLYTELADRSERELRFLRSRRDLPVLDTVYRTVAAVLGCPPEELRPDANFADLGGDSLSAVSCARLLGDVFDIDVQVAAVSNPARSLRSLAEYIARRRSAADPRVTCAGVHAEAASELSARELALEKFFDTAAAPMLARPRTPAAPTVLLTGANGFLGRFLCLAWLRRLADSGGTLICVVRGPDAATARARLEAAFGGADPRLRQDFEVLAADRLEVVAGDMVEPRLGMPEDLWCELADRVDVIVHAAALVNHMLGYDSLFGPNVAGTAEIIRLAVTTRLKPIDFVSSVAAAVNAGEPTLREDDDIRAAHPVRRIGADYADGYGHSKWAAEVLLREAHDRYGLPVTVFRSGMMLAHRHYTGQLNGTDTFTRLLYSLVSTGIAPGSFYRGETDDRHRRAHYDGLPVDFVAGAIAGLGDRRETDYRTFHLVNPHDDGVSLDRFTDHLDDAGYIRCRIDDYDEWLTRFTLALRALPEARRRQSMLPLLDAIRSPAAALPGSAFSSDRFRAALKEGKAIGVQDIPHLSGTLTDTYLAAFRARGLM